MILEVTIVAYPCLLMLKCGKKRIPGTAGRNLDSRSDLWYPPFQTYVSFASKSLCYVDSERTGNQMLLFTKGVLKGAVNCFLETD